MATTHDATYFPNVAKLLEEVKMEFENGSYRSMEDCLNTYIRKRRYWPMIQTKKYFGKSGLLLLHNTYKRDDVAFFKDLYEEVRSVVLDLNAADGEHVVVCLADKVPDRLSVTEYETNYLSESDSCHECLEGTMVYVYNHNGDWYFSTSTCPNVNYSRYFHPTKTHGEMLDEILQSFYPLYPLDELRTEFTSTLDSNMSYGFLIVHHENKHVMDYTPLFGESYKRLYHIFTKDKHTSAPVSVMIDNLYYPRVFESPKEAIVSLSQPLTYGIIVRKEDHVYKVSTDEILQAEKENLGNSNPWINMLSIYMQQNPNYHINDYIEKYMADKKDELILVDSKGQEMVPVYVIHTVMATLKSMLYQFYSLTTDYDVYSKKYTMNKDIDSQYAPIIRFHLAQLRHLQVSVHKHSPITEHTVNHYLCLHQTLKNIRLLIQHVATSDYVLSSRTYDCFHTLNTALQG